MQEGSAISSGVGREVMPNDGHVSRSGARWPSQTGNQLWQIAGTLGLARRVGDEPRFPTTWSYRPYFSLPEEAYSDEVGVWARELATEIDPRHRIYLQNYSLFKDHVDEVREWFQPSTLARAHLLEIGPLGLPPRAAIHVRRGDNVVQPDWYWLPTIEYLVAGAAMYPLHELIIFSDDPQWCRDELVPVMKERVGLPMVIEGTPRVKEYEPGYWTAPVMDWVDLFLMASCEGHVISNSSYSWWGAFLACDETAVYPAQWYGPALAYLDTSVMMPPGWRKLG